MHVFITGATGFIGKVLIAELLSAGHTITGLSRSPASSTLLTSLGATPHPGSLSDLPALTAGAAAADAVIHLAFFFNVTDYTESVETDKRAIRALAAAGKPLLVTSGTLLLRHGQVGSEDDVYSTSAAPFHVRGESEELAKTLGGVVVRLAPVVHGDNDAQFLPRLIAVAREKGISVYVGDGRNRWPAVHVRDAAVAYRLAVEKGVRQGSTLHVVAEGGVPVRDIAAAVGEKLGVPVGTRTAEDAAAEYFGWFASVVGTDNPVESARTKEVLGWTPTQRGLIDDLRDGNYFN